MAFINKGIILLKGAVKKIPIAFTKNQQYDKQTKQIIKKICTAQSNCIDVGTHKGEILDLFIKNSPAGHHYGFEPIPSLYSALIKKYNHKTNVHLYDYALSDKERDAEFNYVVSNPAYSGLIKRRYDHKNEKDTTIKVHTQLLDAVIPADKKIDLIKIDVEGGEINVLRGAVNTIAKSSPVIIFESGLGGSELYGATPEIIYALFQQFGYKLSLLKNYLNNKAPLTPQGFNDQFYQGLNYYFVAYKFSQ